MADNTTGTVSPEQQMHKTLQMSHGVAQQAAKAHTDGLAKMMQAIQGLHSGAMAASAPPAGPPMPPGGPDPSQGGGDPQQAVWDAFPSTDPQSVQRIVEQAGGVEQAFPALAHMLEQDQQQLQEKWIEAVAGHLSQPSGEPEAGPAPANPGIGGEQTGAY